MSELVDMTMMDAEERMEKALAHARSEFSSVRSGRAAPELVEKLIAEAYGVEMRIVELASVSVPEARQLMVVPHDAANMDAIEKAIIGSDLGLAPNNDGRALRLNFPALTTERRKELVKVVKSMAEDSRVAVRNIRREARKDLDKAEKDSQIGSDELVRAEKDLDSLTQKFESGIDSALSAKEEELLEV